MSKDFEVRSLTVADLWRFFSLKKRTVAAGPYRELLREVSAGRVKGGFVAGLPVVIGAVQTFTADGPRIAWIDVAGSADVPVRSLLRAVAAYIDAGGSDRVTALVAIDQPKHQRFVRLCGFLPTGVVVADLEIWRHELVIRQHGAQAVQHVASLAAAAAGAP